MSDIYDTLSLEELTAVAEARGLNTRVDGDPRTALTRLLVDADEKNRTQQHENLNAVRMRQGKGIFERLASRIKVTDEVATSCPECFDTGIKIVNTELAPSVLKSTYQQVELSGPGAARCACETGRLRQARLNSRLAVIPPRYTRARLETLAPDGRHPMQGELIAAAKAHPDHSFFIAGRQDVGKTHILWSIYHHLISRDVPAFASSLFDLVESVKMAIGRGEAVSRLIPEMETYERMAIFLDDVNKARPTEFVAELVFNLLDRVYRNNHQLVVTSQLKPDDLVEYFDDKFGSYGGPIVRRMRNEDTAYFEMF